MMNDDERSSSTKIFEGLHLEILLSLSRVLEVEDDGGG